MEEAKVSDSIVREPEDGLPKGGRITKYSDLNGYWEQFRGKHSVVTFYSNKYGNPHPYFSNFFEHRPFGFTIPCGIFKEKVIPVQFSETAIMACKASLFGDKKVFKRICNADSPAYAKKLGRQIRNFDQKTWDENVCEIAKSVIYQKFAKVPGLKKCLLDTGNALIAEASPRDQIWGIGLHIKDPRSAYPCEWNGSNILGWALMQTREIIKVLDAKTI